MTGPGAVELIAVDLPSLAPDMVRVSVDGCGVCGSNLPVWEGRPWFSYPLPPGAPGHEAWGTVVAVGAGVDDSVCRAGDRVAFLFEQAFADAVDVPADAIVHIPEALADQPFPGEALGCAVNVAARARFAPGQTVAVIGTGFIGALVVALAADAGAHVIAISRRSFSLEVARRMGAKELVALRDQRDVVAEVEELTNGAMCDVVVEAVGTQEPLDLAAKLSRESGRLVIAGFHQDGTRTLDIGMWNWKGLDVINAHFRDRGAQLQGMRRAADLVSAGRLDPTPLYTHTFPLEGLADAMNTVVERPDGFLKALVVR